MSPLPLIKKKAYCEKVGELEGGKVKYLCHVDELSFPVVVYPDGRLEIESDLVLPNPDQYKRIVKSLRKLGEKIAVV